MIVFMQRPLVSYGWKKQNARGYTLALSVKIATWKEQPLLHLQWVASSRLACRVDPGKVEMTGGEEDGGPEVGEAAEAPRLGLGCL
jgi:hypothetical protein